MVLTKVGLPAADIGLRYEDVTIAELLKQKGYANGQFGKNHLGDRPEFLPTAHGFDEFYGNLNHLNTEEEPENPDYPKNPDFFAKYGPQGVVHSYAEEGLPCPDEEQLVDRDKSENQTICLAGALDTKRMPYVDQEFLDHALDFVDDHANQEPFFLWYNTTRTHVFTHLQESSDGVTEQGIYADAMAETDKHVGQLLNKIEEKGLKDNTIIIYTTDNGAEVFTWPDGGTTPFHSEKNTTWEGGVRVPFLISWPGVIEPGQVSNAIMSLQDLFPTIMHAVGEPDIKEKLACSVLDEDKTPALGECKSYIHPETGNQEYYHVHVDGYDFYDYLDNPGQYEIPGQPTKTKIALKELPREEYFYITDDGYPSALRYEDWKIVFTEQRAEGYDVWSEPYVKLRVPRIINLRRDPFEKAMHESSYYDDWWFRHIFAFVPSQVYMSQFLETFKNYPPRQKPASFSIDDQIQDLLDYWEQNPPGIH